MSKSPKTSRPWPELILDLFYPPNCPGCGRDGYGLCGSCCQKLVPQFRHLGEGIDVFAVGEYERELRHALLQMKLNGYTYLAYALAELMLQALPKHLGEEFPVAVVPMPPSRRRWRQRGFHCPYLLAKALARMQKFFIYRPDILRLTRDLAEQKTLTRAGRFANVKGAYRAAEANGLSILLVDDVLTTGASAREAALALYSAGALKVDVAVIASRR